MRSGAPVVRVVALRHPRCLVRWTVYPTVVCDERLLLRAHPFVSAASRATALILVSGSLLYDGDSPLRVSPGEAVLLAPRSMESVRLDKASFLDLSWTDPQLTVSGGVQRLATPSDKRVREMIATLEDPNDDQPRALSLVFDVFRSLGTPVPFGPEALEGAPTEIWPALWSVNVQRLQMSSASRHPMP